MKLVSSLPRDCGHYQFDLKEVMYYLYLPVRMDGGDLRLPENISILRTPIWDLINRVANEDIDEKVYRYIYVSARKGWATPDNPLNRPGWHADGFGTNDLNFVWWDGPGTRFAVQEFTGIVSDHNRALAQFDAQVREENVVSNLPAHHFYRLDPTIVHDTPRIVEGCMRTYIKISMSDHRYNLENNSHNYLFNYHWKLHPRNVVRNDPHSAQTDYYTDIA